LNIILDDPDAPDKWYWYWAHFYRGSSYGKLGMVQKAADDLEIASEDDNMFLQDEIQSERRELDLDD
jgi:hypothetical protein